MDRDVILKTVVRDEVADYANVSDWRAKSYFLENDAEQAYVVVHMPAPDHPDFPQALVVLMARVVGDKVVIEQDSTDRPLYEELLRCGVAREQIILAYAGEALPEEA